MMNSLHRPARSPLASSADEARPADRPMAVLIDGSAIFTTLQSVAPPSVVSDLRPSFNYLGLIDLLVTEFDGQLHRPGSPGNSVWTMWTSADVRNQGQQKFLEFAEKRLHWEVRTNLPSQSFMVEPQALFGVGHTEAARSGRLLRFDASIAFAMGRLAETHRLIVVSDSFALSSSVVLVNEHWGKDSCALVFSGMALDQRWHPLLRSSRGPRFIDLDLHQQQIFGFPTTEVQVPAATPGGFVF